MTDESTPPPEAGQAEVLAAWDHARAALGVLAPALPCLRWVQSNAAGIGDQHLHEVLGPGVVLTSAAGVYADLVAEHAMMLMLALYRRLPELLDQQRRGQWEEIPTYSLGGKTLGIIGAGGIGQAAARLGHAFGMRVIGMRRSPGDIPEMDETLRMTALPELLAAADVLLLAAPITPQTRGLIDATALRRMRPSSILINVGRGPLVVTDDLLYALHEGWIAGAGLDVTEPEPLPPDHPLWHAPGVIITPHHANPPALSMEGSVQRLCENLRRYLAGEPLMAVVEPERGY
jgi:phosphoglycerate dehydrogenase-like enzyme